jgi:anti-sigma regulatory factor (Ser/Thr protein kinase)
MNRGAEREFSFLTRQLGPGLDALGSELRGRGLSDEAVLDLRLVAEEVLTNVAKYGHDDDAEHRVRARLTLVRGEVTLEFTDDGRPFDPLAAKPRDLTAGGERPLGGLGLELVRSLVDEVEYARVGSENVLTLRKRVVVGGGTVP